MALSTIMVINLYCARLPAIYNNVANFAPSTSAVLWTYDNAMLIVILSIVPIVSVILFIALFTLALICLVGPIPV